jgi:hypothetical protein
MEFGDNQSLSVSRRNFRKVRLTRGHWELIFF